MQKIHYLTMLLFILMIISSQTINWSGRERKRQSVKLELIRKIISKFWFSTTCRKRWRTYKIPDFFLERPRSVPSVKVTSGCVLKVTNGCPSRRSSDTELLPKRHVNLGDEEITLLKNGGRLEQHFVCVLGVTLRDQWWRVSRGLGGSSATSRCPWETRSMNNFRSISTPVFFSLLLFVSFFLSYCFFVVICDFLVSVLFFFPFWGKMNLISFGEIYS